jgi:hypothetical protein
MESALIDQASEQYLGQWKQLVSTTNWEKGRIIHAWREALRASKAPGAEYSDEAWARRVGLVTPQHVGRLRRAYERFGATHGEYSGLYWSHFQAALDWNDAEMYLEGAVQNGWSISEMRGVRWEAMGGSPTSEPTADAAADATPWDEGAGEILSGSLAAAHVPGRSTADDEQEEDFDRSEFDDDEQQRESPFDPRAAKTPLEGVRPFADLPSLPADVNDAFEAYKLCILRHKLAGWQEIAREDLLLSLDALKQLALAPASA